MIILIRNIPLKENESFIVAMLDQHQSIHSEKHTLTKDYLSYGLYYNNHYLGGITGYTLGNRCHISLLSVNQTHRSKGYGNQLLQHIEHVAKQRKCSHLTVSTQDYQALSFYQHHNFVIFGELKDSPFKGTTKYYLKKELISD